MSLGFEDFEIVVEPCPMTMRENDWIWSVRHREDSIVLTFGRSRGGRAEACSEAAQAVFRLLAADASQAPANPYRTARTGAGR